MLKQVLSLHFTKFVVECWILHHQINTLSGTWEGLLSLHCSVVNILEANTSLADDFLAKVLYSAYGSKQGLAPNILSLVWMPQQPGYRLNLCFGFSMNFCFTIHLHLEGDRAHANQSNPDPGAGGPPLKAKRRVWDLSQGRNYTHQTHNLLSNKHAREHDLFQRD